MIVIDSDNYDAAGIKTLFFKGGEPHAKLPIFTEDVLLFLKLRTWNDVGLAVCVIDALSRQSKIHVYAFIPYWPGARQDRSHNKKDPDDQAPCTLEIVGRMFSWDRRPRLSDPDAPTLHLISFDVHSDKAYIHTGIERNLMPADMNIPLREGVTAIIAPDKGALLRATQFRDTFYPNADLITCLKHRNPQTGWLSRYEFPPSVKPGHHIVVDDICDGGSTFNLLAQGFTAAEGSSNSTLELFVSHGIFSAGLDNIDPLFSHITTTDSFCQLKPNERLTILPLQSLFWRIISNTWSRVKYPNISETAGDK